MWTVIGFVAYVASLRLVWQLGRQNEWLRWRRYCDAYAATDGDEPVVERARSLG